jgi:hypothetical protein
MERHAPSLSSGTGGERTGRPSVPHADSGHHDAGSARGGEGEGRSRSVGTQHISLVTRTTIARPTSSRSGTMPLAATSNRVTGPPMPTGWAEQFLL